MNPLPQRFVAFAIRSAVRRRHVDRRRQKRLRINDLIDFADCVRVADRARRRASCMEVVLKLIFGNDGVLVEREIHSVARREPRTRRYRRCFRPFCAQRQLHCAACRRRRLPLHAHQRPHVVEIVARRVRQQIFLRALIDQQTLLLHHLFNPAQKQSQRIRPRQFPSE